MATIVVKSTVRDIMNTSDSAIAAILNGVTTTHIYAITEVPISNTKSKVTMYYD